jgi:hypothetical protein
MELEKDSWFRNLSTSVLEMGVLFLYGFIMASIRPLSGVLRG